jgi:hypothetical protein
MKIDIFLPPYIPKFLKAFEKKISPQICKELPCTFSPICRKEKYSKKTPESY